MKNTHQKGQIRTIIFKEGNTWYGVALELNIIESGNDPREIMLLLDEAIRGYVRGASKAKLNEKVLNQDSDPEYETLWSAIESNKPIRSPIKVYSSSSIRLPSFA
ncbi:MAG: hypothetical protein AAB470_01600 [Patescibacteria group bacterium]